MGKRGPKPKEKTVAVPLKGIPKPPKGLDADARKHWTQLASLLNEAGYGSSLDADAMEGYITVWSRWKKAEDELAKPPEQVHGGKGGGYVITTINGYRQLNPWYVIARESLKELKSYFAEFGLSPKARSKLILPEPEEVDSKWEDFEDPD